MPAGSENVCLFGLDRKSRSQGHADANDPKQTYIALQRLIILLGY